MKKKIFSTLLMGAFFLASMSMFTSCKDYDDDINAVKNDVAALQTALDQCKANCQTEREKLSQELAAVKSDLSTEKTRSLAAEAALESRIQTLEGVIGDINNLQAELDKKVDVTTYTRDLEGIYARLEAVETGLGGALTRIGTLETGLANEILAREAVAADLEQQKTALNLLSQKVENYYSTLDGKISQAKTDLLAKIAEVKGELEGEISTLRNEINTLRSQVNTNTSDIASLKTTVANLVTRVSEIVEEVNVLNVFATGQLRSLVFLPQTYYFGIEATQAYTLNYVYYNQFTGNKWVVANADVKEPIGYDKCERYPSKPGSTALDVVAQYHMNPSIADEPDDVTILDADKQYIDTRASGAGISVKKFEKVGDKLNVTLKFQDPNKIKSIKNEKMVTVFAAEAKYFTGEKDTTVTSDYAAIYKSTIDSLVISHTQKGYYFENLKSYSFVNQVNTCKHDFGNGHDNQHSTLNCTLNDTKDLHLIPSVYEAMQIAYQDYCRYDQTLDLAALVETHYMENGVQKVMDAELLAAYGLKYVFELTASFEGGNKTSEAAHAGIKGTTFRPQIPKTDGTAYSYDEFTALNENLDNVRSHSVGRQPIVRVSLIDTNNDNRVIDYGYIKIRITDRTPEEVVKPNVSISYTGDPINYKSECKPADWTLTTTWNQIEYDVLRKLGTTKDEFDANYDRNGQLVINNAGDVMQYDVTTIDLTKATEADELNPYIGTVTDNYDAQSPETSTLTWTISGAYIEKTLYGKASANPFQIAVRYKSLDKAKYPDLYIVLRTGEITISRSSGIFLKDDGSDRIKEYWYKTNGNGATDFGDKEIHSQTLSPEDPNAGTIADKLDTRFSDVFYNNEITLASVIDITPDHDFAANKRLYNFVFSPRNNGMHFNGIDTLANGDFKVIDWELKVFDEGKTLKASEDGLTWYMVATIDGSYTDANGIKNQTIKYGDNQPNNLSRAAVSLLNYKAHNELANDVLDAIVALKVKTNVCEHELDLTNKEFDVRFLRPITVDGKNGELEDAQDKIQKIALYDLVALKDWREYGFATHEDYWKYYNIKSIRVIGNYNFGKLNDQTTGIVNPYIYTTMTSVGAPARSLDDKVKQSAVSNQVLLRLIEGDANANNLKDKYGYLLYENLSTAVQTFTVRLPLEVQYEWGYVVTYADVTIKNTHENAKRF